MHDRGGQRVTPYEVLGIGPKAKPAEITAAYRVLAQIFHPDRFASAPAAVQKEAERRMGEVNDAYAFFRGSNNSAGENSVARTRAVTRPDGTSTTTAVEPPGSTATRPVRTAHTPSAIVPCPQAVE